MDPAYILRQGLGSLPPRQSHYTHGTQLPQHQHQHPHHSKGQGQGRRQADYDSSDDDGSGNRVAHTLTACCRCRQRKTRCDPNLPRCVPCERSGSACEYIDTAKGKKINRYYVVRLQDRVRALEAELGQYTDDEADYPRSNEDIVRPGGMIRVKASDETPRYLGPSSEVAMTRLLMEEAKRYTESHRISELIPEVRARSQARMQSIQMTGPAAGPGRKSYPMVSELPAESLPSREMADRLVDVYKRKSQLLWPLLHEKHLESDFAAVYAGDSDLYKNFIVRMVIATSLQRLDIQYAGLADSYYMAAMRYAEALIRPKDIKSLQCLVLMGQYSMLTPTRAPFYYVIGLAARICQQEGLADEQTISTGLDLDPEAIDMRRRLVWIVATIESGLSYHMGRPSSFATNDDRMEVAFFSAVADEHIGPKGIFAAPPSQSKLVAIHLCKTRRFQAEIRRVLYDRKRAEPKDDSHPWYGNLEQRLQDWLRESPENPSWSRPYFAGHFHQLRISLYRPSPQVPQPSAQAASRCFESSAFVLNQTHRQIESGATCITWNFLLTLNAALNALLWATSYPEVRAAHPREEVDALVNQSLLSLDRCAERWPATAHTSQLYAIFAKACLQSYECGPNDGDAQRTAFSLASPPPSGRDLGPRSPNDAAAAAAVNAQQEQQQQQQLQQQQQQQPFMNAPPHFGHVFNSSAESMNSYALDPRFPPPHPTFRSNSIFGNPASEPSGRRFSYFPPEFNQPAVGGAPEEGGGGGGGGGGGIAPTVPPQQTLLVSEPPGSSQLPTPPESLPTGGLSTATSATFSPPGLPSSSNLSDASTDGGTMPVQVKMSPGQKPMESSHTSQSQQSQQQQKQPTPTSLTSQPPPPALQQQFPLPPAPTTPVAWLSPSGPFLSPYNFGPMSGALFHDATMPNSFAADPAGAGLGLFNTTTGAGSGSGGSGSADAGVFGPMSLSPAASASSPSNNSGLGLVPPGRQGSLTQEQQLELMRMLETEGAGDIDNFLNAGAGGGGGAAAGDAAASMVDVQWY